ncbi:MAG: hypothetical protein ACLU4J_10275 [Butyricimonas paravirosa]
MPDFKTEQASNEILISASVSDMLEIGVGGKSHGPFRAGPAESECLPLPEFTTRVSEYDDVMVLVDERHLAKLNDWGRGGFRDCY